MRKPNEELKVEVKNYYKSQKEYSKDYDSKVDNIRLRLPTGYNQMMKDRYKEFGYKSVNDMIRKLIEEKIFKINNEENINDNVLKICPFCGHLPTTKVKVTQMGGGEDHIDFSVVCEECGTDKTVRLKIKKSCVFMDVDNAMEQVTKAWNRRVDEDET